MLIGGQTELKLGLLMTKGQLEVEVVCARGIQGDPPGTLCCNCFPQRFFIEYKYLNVGVL